MEGAFCFRAQIAEKWAGRVGGRDAEPPPKTIIFSAIFNSSPDGGSGLAVMMYVRYPL